MREPSQGAPWTARGAEVAIADLEDAHSLARALSGASGAYLLTPPSFTAPSLRARSPTGATTWTPSRHGTL
ncbi:MAG: hypothetical protein ACLP1X_24780 [Polyangiaceae bacterium]